MHRQTALHVTSLPSRSEEKNISLRNTLWSHFTRHTHRFEAMSDYIHTLWSHRSVHSNTALCVRAHSHTRRSGIVLWTPTVVVKFQSCLQAIHAPCCGHPQQLICFKHQDASKLWLIIFFPLLHETTLNSKLWEMLDTHFCQSRILQVCWLNFKIEYICYSVIWLK